MGKCSDCKQKIERNHYAIVDDKAICLKCLQKRSYKYPIDKVLQDLGISILKGE